MNYMQELIKLQKESENSLERQRILEADYEDTLEVEPYPSTEEVPDWFGE